MKVKKQAKRQAKQIFRLCLVNNLLDEARIRQVVQHTAAARYRNRPAILAHFLRLLKLDRLQHTARVESAAPLPADVQAVIEGGLARRYGKGLTISFVSRPSLIGGLRIQVGSDLYDSSVLAGLSLLEQNF